MRRLRERCRWRAACTVLYYGDRDGGCGPGAAGRRPAALAGVAPSTSPAKPVGASTNPSTLIAPDASSDGENAPAQMPFTGRWMAALDETTVAGVASTVLRARVAIARAAIVGSLVAATWGLLSPRSYTANFSFFPQEATPTGGLASIAMDLGLSLGGSLSQSPEFYADLLKTRQILSNLVDRKFSVPTDSGLVEQSLLDILVPSKRQSTGRRKIVAIRDLRERIDVRFGLKTNVVFVTIKAESAELAEQICQTLIAEVNQFNSETRSSQSRAERIYAERRMAEADAELRQAERKVQSFVERNRVFESSPSLVTEKVALDREVGLRNNLYINIRQAYDNARLQEVRTTPVITIVEQPERPALPDRRMLIAKFILGGALGALVAAFVAFVGQSLGRAASLQQQIRDDLPAIVDSVIDDARHPLRFATEVIPWLKRFGFR
jgi:tyrosine-protein kinase Etk/Wzc